MNPISLTVTINVPQLDALTAAVHALAGRGPLPSGGTNVTSGTTQTTTPGVTLASSQPPAAETVVTPAPVAAPAAAPAAAPVAAGVPTLTREQLIEQAKKLLATGKAEVQTDFQSLASKYGALSTVDASRLPEIQAEIAAMGAKYGVAL